MVAAHVWHLWPGRHWPALPHEEQQFVHDLQQLATLRPRGVERMHYTAILNGLRCGLTADELLSYVPGMRPADLVAAYVHLEKLRMQAWEAWQAILEEPTQFVITELGPAASVLMPVPLYRMATVASNVNNAQRLTATVETIAAEVRAHVNAANAIENLLLVRQAPDPHGVELGTKLHNPRTPALWGSPYFLPGRVGALSPVRVAELLGEAHR